VSTEAHPTGFAGLLQPINEAVTPLIKAGFGTPFINPFGLTVLEVPGRKSGRIYTLPVVCWSLYNIVIVSTVRSESQWIRNLAAAETVSVWLRGRRREAATMVIMGGDVVDRETQPHELMLQPLKDASRLSGVSIGILTIH